MIIILVEVPWVRLLTAASLFTFFYFRLITFISSVNQNAFIVDPFYNDTILSLNCSEVSLCQGYPLSSLLPVGCWTQCACTLRAFLCSILAQKAKQGLVLRVTALIQCQVVNYSSDGGQSCWKVNECRVLAKNLPPNGAYNTIGGYETPSTMLLLGGKPG